MKISKQAKFHTSETYYVSQLIPVMICLPIEIDSILDINPFVENGLNENGSFVYSGLVVRIGSALGPSLVVSPT